MTRELTGRHVLTIAVLAFGIIIAVNMVMLFAATGSFPGLVVKNSYIASQQWNAKTDLAKARGWTAAVRYSGGQLVVNVTDASGAPVTAGPIEARIGRPARDDNDRTMKIVAGQGVAVDLDPGLWLIKLSDSSGAWYQTARIFVAGDNR